MSRERRGEYHWYCFCWCAPLHQGSSGDNDTTWHAAALVRRTRRAEGGGEEGRGKERKGKESREGGREGESW